MDSRAGAFLGASKPEMFYPKKSQCSASNSLQGCDGPQEASLWIPENTVLKGVIMGQQCIRPLFLDCFRPRSRIKPFCLPSRKYFSTREMQSASVKTNYLALVLQRTPVDIPSFCVRFSLLPEPAFWPSCTLQSAAVRYQLILNKCSHH